MDNVKPFTAITGGIGQSTDSAGIVSQVKQFLEREEIMSADISDDDVQLEYPRPDEQRLGALTAIEKEIFILAQLLRKLVEDEAINISASTTSRMADIMREKRVDVQTAALLAGQQAKLPDTLPQCVYTGLLLDALFRWSVSSRFCAWTGNIIVRSGFVAYRYE